MIPKIDDIAKQMMAPGKGILAADESTRTMEKRLDSISLPHTDENERLFRQLLFTTPHVEEYLSGVILFDATVRRSADDGDTFPRLLEKKGIIPGIKVDKGVVDLPNFKEEHVSTGLDGLDERLKDYYGLGARFTKWRSVIKISDNTPSDAAIHANAYVLSLYAGIVQRNNMVPMVEPEVLFDGTHTLEQSGKTIERTLTVLFQTLKAFRVHLPGLVLKTSMALPGRERGVELNPIEIGKETVRALKASVPDETGGVVFLSGGQTPVQATENLNAVAQHNMPWPVTFSYSRALEEPVLEAWRGLDDNVSVAQQALQHRLALNVAARKGKYKKEME